MKQLMSPILFFLVLAASAAAQVTQDTTVKAAPDTANVHPEQNMERHSWHKDTIHLGSILIVTNSDNNNYNVTRVYKDTSNRRWHRLRNVRTKFLILDLGLNNYVDKTQYFPNNYASYAASPVYKIAPRTSAQGSVTSSEFTLIPEKSVNVNIWLFMQRINLIHHILNFQYGFGAEMNNYRYQNNITYVPGYQTTIIRDSVNFKKNKLFTEYLTIPAMLNIDTNPYHPSKSVQLSFGLSGGILFKDRTKQESDARGKVKDNDAFDLQKYRVAFVGELGLSFIHLYYSYSLTTIHQDGLQQYPYSVGFRLNYF